MYVASLSLPGSRSEQLSAHYSHSLFPYLLVQGESTNIWAKEKLKKAGKQATSGNSTWRGKGAENKG